MTGEKESTAVCAKCILPATFPGITINADGVCSICARHSKNDESLRAGKKEYEQKFHDLLNNHVLPFQSSRRGYDILMAYSGGKDSTYTMALLRKKYRLRVLALSFDNGFIAGQTMLNINNVTTSLGVDHIFFRPKWEVLKLVFSAAGERELYSRKSLERASTICTTCMGMVKSVCLKMAIEQDIPLIGYGWSPGQAPLQSAIMKNNPALSRMAQQSVLVPLRDIAGEEIEPYFLRESHYADAGRFPYNVHPMAWEFYDEKMILEEISGYGWTAPADTDSNSTNCLLNAYANKVHMNRYGFHPYAWEIANMVRDGIMPREDGYRKIYAAPADNISEMAEQRLKS